MKIAFLGYPEPDGKTFGNGVARVIYNQAEYLKSRGYEVYYYHLFSKEQYQELPKFLVKNNISIAVWHMTTLRIKKIAHTPCPIICLWHTSPYYAKSFKSNPFDTLKRFANKHGLPIRADKLFDMKILQSAFISLHSIFNTIMFCFITAKYDKVVLLSQYYISSFLPAKLFPNKVTAIPNMISAPEGCIDIEKKENIALFVGRLENCSKRIDLLLEVWSIAARNIDWELIICGDGPDKNMLLEKKQQLQLENVRFVGYVKPEPYYRSASIICLSSVYEGFPMVIAEAKSYGCVPIAFDSFEAVHDLITDNVNGRLIPSFDKELYSSALIDLMYDRNKRQAFATQSMKDVTALSQDRIMSKWENLFSSLVIDKSQ